MRIAIIDDIILECEDLHRRVETQLSRISLYADIIDYENGANFLSDSQIEHFDLVFLDIYMQNENGIDIAKMLRQFDKDCLLVFTTTSTDHALDAFRVRAIHYLVKPYTDNELAILFDEIVKLLPTPEPYIEINASGSIIRLYFQKILYAEHYLHQIYIYTTDDKKIVIRQTFHEFCTKLEDDRFFLCNRGIIINLEHVKDFDKTDFILMTNKRIPVSRRLVKTAHLAFCDFLFKRGPRS